MYVCVAFSVWEVLPALSACETQDSVGGVERRVDRNKMAMSGVLRCKVEGQDILPSFTLTGFFHNIIFFPDVLECAGKKIVRRHLDLTIVYPNPCAPW